MGSETPAFDRSGYTVEQQGGGEIAVSWAVTRDVDGTGLGAFPDDEAVNAAIESDRAASPAPASRSTPPE